MNMPFLASSRWLGIVASLASVAVLGVLLTVTIYWTLFDPMWIAFLGGVLIAALLAAASRASTVEWRLARRTLQLAKLRAKLDQEAKRAHTATAAFRTGEDRMRVLFEALPTPVFFIDREHRCHLHNTPAAMAARRPHESIDGRPLYDTVGKEMYGAMEPFLADALSGRATSQDLVWHGLQEGDSFGAQYVPFPDNDPHPTGVFIVLTPRARAPAAPADDGKDDLAYLRALSEKSTAWDEPRTRLSRALKENQFLLLAQPLLALKPQDPDQPCCEILLRMKEEEDHLLPPGSFFPIAERYGMMEELDRWVVRELITRCHESRHAGQPARPALYCVNLSEAAVRSHAFARFVQKQLLDWHFAGRSLCFEIAEHDIAPWHAEVARLISMLKPFGCRFTVDGFGSVKGSFATLKGLAFDFVKIDGVVVQNMRRHPGDLAKVRAIVTVCRHSGMRAIAEFVEDEETLVELRAAGVDYAQGFGVARPAPLSDLIRDRPPALATAA